MVKKKAKSSVRSKDASVKESKVVAKKEFGDCHPEHKAFWARDGQILKNITELPKAVLNMNNEVFHHHVNEEKHDIANWVEHVYEEKELAQALRGMKSRSAIARTIRDALR